MLILKGNFVFAVDAHRIVAFTLYFLTAIALTVRE